MSEEIITSYKNTLNSFKIAKIFMVLSLVFYGGYSVLSIYLTITLRLSILESGPIDYIGASFLIWILLFCMLSSIICLILFILNFVFFIILIKKGKQNKKINLWLKICVLVFCNIISGIILLCNNDL